MDQKYYTPITVPCFDTDALFRMKVAAFMDHAQEIAYAAATHHGFGYDALHEHHTAWVLSRMHIRIVKAPLWREKTVLETWHKGMDGLFFHRDFNLRDENGEVAVAATSAWLVIDTGTRRLVKSQDVLEIVPWTTICEENAIEEPAPKLVMPKEGREAAGVHRVSYSDVDIIGHTNNARYMVWAMDVVDYEDAAGRKLTDAWINFNRETVPGEEIAMERLKLSLPGGGIEYFIEGKVGDKSAFVVRILFE